MLGSTHSDLRHPFLSDPEVTSLLRLLPTTDDAGSELGERTRPVIPPLVPHFLNDSNYRNILSGTARLREKWQLQQDCNRKNSHQGLKTQCLC